MLSVRRATIVTLLPLLALFIAASPTGFASAASASTPAKHKPLPRFHRPIISLGASQSGNWSGYNQGTVEQGGTKLFNQVAGDWNVPTATQHTSGQAENSATWIGIGGGCVDAGCTVTDESLIQTGTEQDVAANGTPSYSAWWEIIPVPSLTVSTLSVHPGDHMHADISELSGLPDEVWTINLQDVTTGQSFSQTVPYTSTMLTAEWINETPTEIGTSGVGEAAMPNLSTVTFSGAQANSANPGLKASEEIDLVNSGQTLATPSAPNSTTNGFDDCTYTTSCS